MIKVLHSILHATILVALLAVSFLLIIYVSSSSRPKPPAGYDEAVRESQFGPQPEQILYYFEGNTNNIERPE